MLDSHGYSNVYSNCCLLQATAAESLVMCVCILLVLFALSIVTPLFNTVYFFFDMFFTRLLMLPTLTLCSLSLYTTSIVYNFCSKIYSLCVCLLMQGDVYPVEPPDGFMIDQVLDAHWGVVNDEDVRMLICG